MSVGRHCAFTLVELLIVLTIISVLAGSAVVSLHGRQDVYALRVSSADLAAAIRFASEQARTTRMPQRLVFSQQRDSFRLETWRSNDIGFTPADGLAGGTHQFPAGVRMILMQDNAYPDDTQDIASFIPNGNGFSGKIQIRNRQGDSALIEVLGKSGQVYVSSSQ